MGEMPDWWPLIKIADRFGCPPWELLDRPDGEVWEHIGVAVLEAEAHTRNPTGRPDA